RAAESLRPAVHDQELRSRSGPADRAPDRPSARRHDRRRERSRSEHDLDHPTRAGRPAAGRGGVMATPLHPPRAADRRVLIVDDDVDLVESLQEVLESRGYDVTTAGNIADAIDTAQAFVPQVAMLDVNLGRENGLTLITTLKELLPETLC